MLTSLYLRQNTTCPISNTNLANTCIKLVAQQ